MSWTGTSDCCTNRNMLWNIAEPTVEQDLINLHGVCQACHQTYTTTLVDTGVLTAADVQQIVAEVRSNGDKPAGNCLPKSTALTSRMHEHGVPATVRTAPFGRDEKLHYVCLFNGAFVEGLTDELYVADATLTQFEGREATSGETVDNIPETVIVPKESGTARTWYASLSPPTTA